MYQRLARLEYENKVDTLEYENILDKLVMMKEVEMSYYEMLTKLYDCKQILGFNVIAKKEISCKNSEIKLIHDPSFLFSDNLKINDIIAMRVSAKIADIFRHMYYTNPADINVYDTYGPIRDKYFLDVLTSQIDDSEYKKYRKMLIDTKYNFAFIYDKNILELLEYDEEDEENEIIDLIASLGTKLNNSILLNEKNSKRFLLDINYIRACALATPIEYLESLKYSIEINDNINEGDLVFIKILEMAIDDKNNFDENDIPYTRRF